MKLVDLVGKKFGKLEVIRRAENLGGRPAWLCECECGEYKVIMAGNLRSGASRSCGCQESLGVVPRDLTNKRFGKLVAITLISSKPPVWKCYCDCGTEIEIRASYLNAGGKRDCGCSWNMEWNTPQQYAGCMAAQKLRKRPFESLYNSLVSRAKRKSIEVFSYEDFIPLTQVRECHYCGQAVTWSKYSLAKNGRATNLDRKDSTKGYITGNVVVCCIRCNKAKLDHFSYEDWVKIGNFIKLNLKEGVPSVTT